MRLAARCERQEIHPTRDAVEGSAAEAAQNLGEAYVRYRRCHAGVLRFGETVAGDGAGDMRAVAVLVHPQVGIFRSVVAPDEVGAADALAVAGDVQVVGVEAGVHHADGNGAAARAGEQSRPVGMEPDRVRAHGWHGGIVSGSEDLHRFHGQHEIRFDDGVEGSRVDVGGVGADVRIEAADFGAVGKQLAPPATVLVMRHQGDQHRHALQGRGVELGLERGVGLALRRYHAKAGNGGQPGRGGEAGFVGWQLGAQQPSRRAENVDAEAGHRACRGCRVGAVGQAQPAEHPVSLRSPRLFRDGRVRQVGEEPVQNVVLLRFNVDWRVHRRLLHGRRSAGKGVAVWGRWNGSRPQLAR